MERMKIEMDKITAERKVGNESGNHGDKGGEALEAKLDLFVAAIEEHARNHRELLKAMERKKTAMVAGRLDEIEEIVEAEKLAIEAIGESDRKRVPLTDEVGAAYGFAPARRMRLLDIVQRVGERHREAILDVRDELRDLAEVINRLNQLNRTLVLHSLEHVHIFLSLLRGADPEAKIYTKAGGGESSKGSILLDRRI